MYLKLKFIVYRQVQVTLLNKTNLLVIHLYMHVHENKIKIKTYMTLKYTKASYM